MIAIDTNVVVRLILEDNPAQIDAIRRLMERDPLFVSLTVLVETGWVLESRYKFIRAVVADALDDLISLERIAVPRYAAVRWAIGRYREGADLADVIHLVAASKSDGFATLDQRLARQAGSNSPIPIETLA